ncbi:hypothetical protein FACS1894205_2120 [Alphaproteobacteria bacterium]|nr:hypothetical protein FACS1894205_2120 [Alphaproteobacteria bacterium]
MSVTIPQSRLSAPVLAALAAGAGAMALAAIFVPEWEGYSPKAYQDSAKVWTICTGHTGGVKPDQAATAKECRAFLESDMGAAFATVERRVKIPISEPTRAALASFVFNVGEGAFATSGVLKKLNGGDIRGACDELTKWVYVTVGGQKMRLHGLDRRRAAERELCLAGVASLQLSVFSHQFSELERSGGAAVKTEIPRSCPSDSHGQETGAAALEPPPTPPAAPDAP